jgi:serine O-acetyltransferase
MSDFAIDLHKMYSIHLTNGKPPLKRRVGFWLTNSELHCVAAYRFGRFAESARRRRRVLGAVGVLAYRIWNRWNTHQHHCEINHGARIGPGFLLMHRHGVTIGPAIIGGNCVIHQNVTIGQRVARGDRGVPTIGNNVWIGTGATLIGAIEVGDGVTISAGTVLSRDVPAGCLVGGNPGRVLAKDYDNSAMLNYQMPLDR